jgi:hypothetical protein
MDSVSKMWSSGCRQACQWYKKAARGADATAATPVILSDGDGGRGCRSACEVWIQNVLDSYYQCLSLPGEISSKAYSARTSCTPRVQAVVARLSSKLNQQQKILQISGRADLASVTEVLMLRQDGQGVEVSTTTL